MSAFDETAQCLQEVSTEIVSAGGEVNTSVQFIQSQDEGFGIFVSAPVASGATLIKVPFNMCISAITVAASVELKPMFEENPGLLDYPDEVVAIGLMHTKLFPESSCTWAKHTKLLPADFNTTLYWSDAELDELKGNTVFHLTKMMKRQIDHDFSTIHQPLSGNYPELLGGVTKELYTWALNVVYSRSLEITRQDKHTRCIVPLLDMANHNPHMGAVSFDTFKYEDDADCISFVACADMSAGDECYAVYGVYPNSKLIYNYGFVVLNNPHRAIDLWVRLPATSVGYAVKNSFLNTQALTREQTYDFKGTIRPNYVSPALLATIRVIQADANELPGLARAVQGKMISVRNEAATYVSLRNLIVGVMNVERAQVKATLQPHFKQCSAINTYFNLVSTILACVQFTLQSDVTRLGELLLNDTPAGDRLRCALIVRVEERKLLEEVLVLVNGWIADLEAQGAAYRPPDAPHSSTAPPTLGTVAPAP